MRVWTDEQEYLSTADFLEGCRKNRKVRHASERFNEYTSYEQALELAKTGWEDGKQEGMALAQEALELAEGPFTVSYEPDWQVSGAEVDISRYLVGVPENMVSYNPIQISNAGRVVRLVVSTSISSAISTASIMRRGAAVIGLAMALEELQHACEVWIDCSVSTGFSEKGKKYGRVRVLVKGALDSIDPASLAYWLGHPSVLRQLMFAAEDGFIGGAYPMYGTPIDPEEDMEEGTIYLPCLRSSSNVEEPERFIIEHLTKLGLIPENRR